MLDWLKYFPLAFRHSNEPVTPKGPYFSALKEQIWIFGDNKLSLKAPNSNSVFGMETHGVKSERVSPRKIDILNREIWPNVGLEAQTKGRWEHGYFFYRDCFF